MIDINNDDNNVVAVLELRLLTDDGYGDEVRTATLKGVMDAVLAAQITEVWNNSSYEYRTRVIEAALRGFPVKEEHQVHMVMGQILRGSLVELVDDLLCPGGHSTDVVRADGCPLGVEDGTCICFIGVETNPELQPTQKLTYERDLVTDIYMVAVVHPLYGGLQVSSSLKGEEG